MAIDTSELDQIIVGRVEPHIYAFTTNTIPNYLKVGDTYRPVAERLTEWKKIFPELVKEFEGSAKLNNGIYFRDFAVHQYLEMTKSRYRLQPGDLGEGIYYSREFFKDATSDDVREAIADIANDYEAKTQRYQFYNAENRLPEIMKFSRTDNYPLRPNQKDVINNFSAAISHNRTNLLMYAVMRFGKSFTSMCCAVEMGAKFVVVVSAKADVKLEWKRTVESHIKFAEYEFITSEDLKNNENIVSEKLLADKRVVCFLTLQDLQGKDIKTRHKEIFEREIDLLLVDESHYGARAEEYGKVLRAVNYTKDIKHKNAEDDFVETKNADKVVKTLKARITIHLSGTPYRILMGSEFKKEDIIAFFQFADIVRAQKDWDDKNILSDSCKEWDNPYFGFPQMIRFAFNPNESSRKRLESLKRSGITYAFSALLEPCSVKKDEHGLHKKFKYEQEVLELFEVIDGSKEDSELLGFLNYDKIKQGNMCRHIVVVLPYCASCDALEQLLKDNCTKFKNLNEYHVINISGVENQKLYKDSSAVKNTIRTYESRGEKTITLTVNRMLTGSTVPEWDTMLYLKDTASPQEYDQAIFRLQNQYIKTFVNDSGETIKLNMKPQTLLVDFDPNRMFVMQEQKSLIYNANVEIGGNTELEKRIREDLQISPIIVLNKDKIERVKAVDILTAVSNYQKDKGIKEEALEIPVDMGILDDATLREVIEKENEIGSRAGLATNAYTGEDDDDGKDMDTPDTGENGDNPETSISSNGSKNKKNDNEKDEQVSLQKKIRSYYARVLLYSFLTKDQVISLSDIIQTMCTDDNRRIAYNIGLNKSVLALINEKIDKFVLSQLDYKIKDLNDLAKSNNMTVDERTSVAISKFGKLGDAIVVTPSNICDDMVGLLPDECMHSVADGKGKLLDIAGTAGEFAIALVKRMTLLGIEKSIIADSIYTIPKSKLCYELIRKVYSMLGLNINNIASFAAYDLLNVRDKKGKIGYGQIVKILTQNKPFNQIKLTDEQQEGDKTVKFEAVVGNPPYQEADGGARKSAQPIYQNFVYISEKLEVKYLSFITPTRWFAGGKGLDDFRDYMLDNPHIQELHDFIHPEEVFPATNNRGGICYFFQNNLFDNSSMHVRIITNMGNNEMVISNRPLRIRNLDIFIRYSQIIPILEKIGAFDSDFKSLSKHVSPRKPFGIESNIIGSIDFHTSLIGMIEPLLCYAKSQSKGYIEKTIVSNYEEYGNVWKVLLPYANNIGTELNDDNQNSFTAPPQSVCTETYLVVGADLGLDEQSAENLSKYLKTKFARCLHCAAKISQHGTAKTYRFVPIQDFTEHSDIDWSKSVDKIDEQLFDKYKLSKEERDFIKSTIKSMN